MSTRNYTGASDSSEFSSPSYPSATNAAGRLASLAARSRNFTGHFRWRLAAFIMLYFVLSTLTSATQERNIAPENQTITGTYTGIVHNTTVDSSAEFAIVVNQQEAALRGCMVVARPLSGSGSLGGKVQGSQIAFDVISRLFTIKFNGARMSQDDISGDYFIPATPTTGPQEGLFTLRRVNRVGLPAGFDLRECPDEFSRQIAGIPIFPAVAQPSFTQDQVQAMVRSGLGDETGARVIGERGIDFAPTEDFLQNLRVAGASVEFLQALRTAKRPLAPNTAMKKPLNQVQVFALLIGQVPSHRVTMLVRERGTDFEPTDDYLQEVRLAGGEGELVGALKTAKVTKLEHIDPALQARQEEANQHMARAAQFMEKKLYADAETELRAAIRLDPQNSDAHFSLGSALGASGDRDDAIAEEREAIRLDPQNSDAHALLGAALEASGDREGAIAEVRDALRLGPDNEGAHATLGAVLADQGEFDAAIAEYREALRLNPGFVVVHSFLGAALEKKGQFDAAIGEYREALRLTPNDSAVHNSLGLALSTKGDVDAAIAEYREALRLDPNNGAAHNSLGLALDQRGKVDAAIAEYREAIRLDPNEGAAHTNLGEDLFKKGKVNAAIAEYREALRLDPNDDEAHSFLGEALGSNRDFEGAIAENRAATRLRPEDPLYHYRLGYWLEKIGDREDAFTEYRTAYTLDRFSLPMIKAAYERLLRKTK